ncbi:hypothetical protein ACFQW4_06875 [Pantoea sp. GCM10028869]|uniref:hypothetical protein n=1 Tax=Pantoea sp. GCM10028869 TaxID=3273417 RepID=UPI00361AF845
MKSNKILFVGQTLSVERPFLDPSTRYRCFNIAYALNKRGHIADVITLDEFIENMDIARQYDKIVFHRPFLKNEKFIDFLLKNNGSERIIADYDDLIFDVTNILSLPEIKTRDPYVKGTANYISRNAAACELFNNFSLSTTPLSNKVSSIFKGKNVKVISNALEDEYVDLSTKLFNLNKPRKYKLGYFPGTASHNADFNEISNYIADFLKENKKERLFILGPLKLPYSLSQYFHRIDHVQETVPFNHLPYIKANVETIIAPLGINEFNNCKSGLKFFEAMPLGCRVIATAIPDIDRFDSLYLDKCHVKSDWEKISLKKQFSKDTYQHELDKTLQKVGANNVAKIWEESFL